MADVETRGTAPVVEDLGRTLGALLRAYLARAQQAVAGVPGGPRGFQVLQLSADQACTNQAGMAAALGLDRTVMTYLLDDLERAGLIERQPDPADRRARRVVLTGEGASTYEAATRAIVQVERETLAGLDDAEAAVLRDLLARAAHGLGHDASACDAIAPTGC